MVEIRPINDKKSYVCLNYATQNPSNFTVRNQPGVKIWYKQENPVQMLTALQTTNVLTTQAMTTQTIQAETPGNTTIKNDF